MISANHLKIVTVAKVGSMNFIGPNLKREFKTHPVHTHDIQVLRNALEKERDTLLVTGIRNPIDRNLSYLFQTFDDYCPTCLRTRANGYNGEDGRIPEMKDNIDSIGAKRVIELFSNKNITTRLITGFGNSLRSLESESSSSTKKKDTRYTNTTTGIRCWSIR